MNKLVAIGLAVIAFLAITFMGFVFWGISLNNTEITLRTNIENKITANRADFDNMKKTILQSAQISDKEVDALKNIIIGYANVRGGLNDNNSNMISISALHEAVPSITSIETLKNLQNIVTAQRNSWTFRQKELIDLKREHDILIRKFPASIIFSILGRHEIEIQIITSHATQEIFKTGQDNDTNLFN